MIQRNRSSRARRGGPRWPIFGLAVVSLIKIACSEKSNGPNGAASASGGAQLDASTGGSVSSGGQPSVPSGGGTGADGGASGGDSSSGDGGADDQSGSGGEENGGAGSGGGEAVDRSYAHGFVPTNIGDAELIAAWDYWKENYIELCGADSARVKWDEPTQTVSEGIAYGMLGAVGMGDRQLFDRLWKYYQDNVDENGLMHWKRAGCAGTAPDENSDNAATDADLDVAMALIQAECKFDSVYGSDADDLITKIYTHETVVSGPLRLLTPGDFFGGATCLNASYFAPAYYRVYAERPAQSARRDGWLQLADDTYVLLARFAHAQTGLVPNWCDEDGNTTEAGPSGCNWYDEADIYGADAMRTPWRVATDYVWFGTPEAKTFLDKITDFVNGEDITLVGRKYELDGTALMPIHHSIMSVGAFADGAMSYDQAMLDTFSAEALTVDDHDYFPDSLRVLYLLLLTGRFDQCAGARLPALPY